MAEITLKGKSDEIKVLKVNIDDKSYSVPLAGSLPIRTVRAMKDGIEDGFDFFEKYIPKKVIESLTMDEFNALNDAWKDASFQQTDTSMGE